MVSLPSRPKIVSAPLGPFSVLFPFVPVMVDMVDPPMRSLSARSVITLQPSHSRGSEPGLGRAGRELLQNEVAAVGCPGVSLEQDLKLGRAVTVGAGLDHLVGADRLVAKLSCATEA